MSDHRERKHFFSRSLINSIAMEISRVYVQFPKHEFLRKCEGLEDLELKQRSTLIYEALSTCLPDSLQESCDILLSSMGNPAPADGSCPFNGPDPSDGPDGMRGFRFMPYLEFVQRNGLEYPDLSFPVLKEMTKHFSGEFAIRDFIIRYPQESLQALHKWSLDEDWRVRRLASEGSRPRLPWASKIPLFIENPERCGEILTRLCCDEVLSVKRSVANHVNDISKDNSDYAIELCELWNQQFSAKVQWTIKHALRSLIKQGDGRALNLLGFPADRKLEISSFGFDNKTVKFGEEIEFSFDLKNLENEAVPVVVDFALHRVLASGKQARKVFKLRTQTLESDSLQSYQSKFSFKSLSTRKYYPGTHKIEIIVNGKSLAMGEFELIE